MSRMWLFMFYISCTVKENTLFNYQAYWKKIIILTVWYDMPMIVNICEVNVFLKTSSVRIHFLLFNICISQFVCIIAVRRKTVNCKTRGIQLELHQFYIVWLDPSFSQLKSLVCLCTFWRAPYVRMVVPSYLLLRPWVFWSPRQSCIWTGCCQGQFSGISTIWFACQFAFFLLLSSLQYFIVCFVSSLKS